MRTLGLLLLAFTVAACDLRRVTLHDLQIVEFGTFQKTATLGETPATGSVQGRTHAVTAAALLERTTDIHATNGTSFGVRVKFVGEPAGVAVPCIAKCFHPRFTDPATGRSSEVEQWDNVGTMGRDGYIGYTFDNDWELVPGQWTIQVSFGSTFKVEKTFNVIATPGE